MNTRARTLNIPFLLLSAAFLAGGVPAALAAPTSDAESAFLLVAEMERPPGVMAVSETERRALQKNAPAGRGLARLEAEVRALWPRVREIDLVGLSRYQVEATRGFLLPTDPGDFAGQVLAWDDADRRWHLELRGPRLPTRYDIVHRYLHFYATYDPASEELGRLIVTIRGWVLE